MTSTIDRDKISGYHPATQTPILNKNPANKTKELIVEDRFHFNIDDDEVGHFNEKTLLELIRYHRFNEGGLNPTHPFIHYKIYKLISENIDAFIRKVQNLEPFGEGKEELTLAEIEELHELGEKIQEAFQDFWVLFLVASRNR